MRMLSIYLLLMMSVSAFAKHQAKKVNKRKPSSVEYDCTVQWKTLREKLPVKNITWRESTNVNIMKGLDVQFKSDERKVTIVVTEKSPKKLENVITYSFTCDNSINCKGKYDSVLDGVKDKGQLQISPQGSRGVGKLDGREIFTYHNQPDGFEYNYVVYYDSKKQPMGLKVMCHE